MKKSNTPQKTTTLVVKLINSSAEQVVFEGMAGEVHLNSNKSCVGDVINGIVKPALQLTKPGPTEAFKDKSAKGLCG